MKCWLFAIGATAAAVGSAHADEQVWVSSTVQVRQSREAGFVGWTDLHAHRRADGLLAIVRPGAGYAFSSSLLVHAGYAWIPTALDEADTTHEHRIWQQALWTPAVAERVKVQLRPRVEQRFGAGDDTGHRVRLFARGQWAPTALPFDLVVWDELFLQLDDTDWGPQSGFDQNRLFVGAGADLKQRGARVDAGYIHVVFPGDKETQHVIGVSLAFTFVVEDAS